MGLKCKQVYDGHQRECHHHENAESLDEIEIAPDQKNNGDQRKDAGPVFVVVGNSDLLDCFKLGREISDLLVKFFQALGVGVRLVFQLGLGDFQLDLGLDVFIVFSALLGQRQANGHRLANPANNAALLSDDGDEQQEPVPDNPIAVKDAWARNLVEGSE